MRDDAGNMRQSGITTTTERQESDEQGHQRQLLIFPTLLLPLFGQMLSSLCKRREQMSEIGGGLRCDVHAAAVTAGDTSIQCPGCHVTRTGARREEKWNHGAAKNITNTLRAPTKWPCHYD